MAEYRGDHVQQDGANYAPWHPRRQQAGVDRSHPPLLRGDQCRPRNLSLEVQNGRNQHCITINRRVIESIKRCSSRCLIVRVLTVGSSSEESSGPTTASAGAIRARSMSPFVWRTKRFRLSGRQKPYRELATAPSQILVTVALRKVWHN